MRVPERATEPSCSPSREADGSAPRRVSSQQGPGPVFEACFLLKEDVFAEFIRITLTKNTHLHKHKILWGHLERRHNKIVSVLIRQNKED